MEDRGSSTNRDGGLDMRIMEDHLLTEFWCGREDHEGGSSTDTSGVLQ